MKDVKIGDLVIWNVDGDVGVITKLEEDFIFIEWMSEPELGGWYPNYHEHLERV